MYGSEYPRPTGSCFACLCSGTGCSSDVLELSVAFTSASLVLFLVLVSPFLCLLLRLLSWVLVVALYEIEACWSRS